MESSPRLTRSGRPFAPTPQNPPPAIAAGAGRRAGLLLHPARPIRDAAPAAPAAVPGIGVGVGTSAQRRSRKHNIEEKKRGTAKDPALLLPIRESRTTRAKPNAPTADAVAIAIANANANPTTMPPTTAQRRTSTSISASASASAGYPRGANATANGRANAAQPNGTSAAGAGGGGGGGALTNGSSHGSEEKKDGEKEAQEQERNIDNVVFGNVMFKSWYPSWYPKEIIGEKALLNGEGGKGGGGAVVVQTLYVCKRCFKYGKVVEPWVDHCAVCQADVPGTLVYQHGKGQREGEGRSVWSVWQVDGGVDTVSPFLSFLRFPSHRPPQINTDWELIEMGC